MNPDLHRLPAPRPADASGAGGESNPDLVLAEPDEALAKDVTARLQAALVKVVACRDGAEALLVVGSRNPRAVLLAAPLPVVDAARVTELIARLCPQPVIVGAGPEGAQEATAALSAGAVAFVARPYRIEEILPLLAPEHRNLGGEPQSLVVGDIELDLAGYHLYIRGRSIALPVREFMVLRHLMERPNRVVTREELTRAVWGVDSLDSNSLTVHIRRLRTRLLEEPGTCCTIDSIRGIGYRLECSPPATGEPTTPRRTTPGR